MVHFQLFLWRRIKIIFTVLPLLSLPFLLRHKSSYFVGQLMKSINKVYAVCGLVMWLNTILFNFNFSVVVYSFAKQFYLYVQIHGHFGFGTGRTQWWWRYIIKITIQFMLIEEKNRKEYKKCASMILSSHSLSHRRIAFRIVCDNDFHRVLCCHHVD